MPTLFNQLDAAQSAGRATPRTSATPTRRPPATRRRGSQPWLDCGAPYATPSAPRRSPAASPTPRSPTRAARTRPTSTCPSTSRSRGSSRSSAPGDCNAAHIANLFDPNDGLYHDLQSEATTPAFSWISPNNCSDAHDAVCHGNNLSGGFSDPNTPNPPLNHTGGLYAADLFLEHVVPEIEASPAFKDGGLIDITFDEAFPPFTYTGNSFANSTIVSPNAATSVASDTAGETLFGHSVNYEPTGPNTPLAKDATGNELYPGPGDNAYIDRPSNCIAQTVPSKPSTTCLLGGGSNVPGARTDSAATAAAQQPTIVDPTIVATDVGRSVTGTGIPAGAFVGKVSDTPTVAGGRDGRGRGAATSRS